MDVQELLTLLQSGLSTQKIAPETPVLFMGKLSYPTNIKTLEVANILYPDDDRLAMPITSKEFLTSIAENEETTTDSLKNYVKSCVVLCPEKLANMGIK